MGKMPMLRFKTVSKNLLALMAALCVTAAAMAQTPAPAGKAPAAAASAPTTAPADSKAATVASVSGRAQKLQAGQEKWQDIAAGDQLDQQTVIRTGLRSRVVLKFQDRAEVVVEDATKVGISEFLQTGTRVRAQVGLKYGSIHVDVPKQNGPTDFSVSTPVATLSIRGTAGEITFSSDAGLHLFSEHGIWHAAHRPHHANVGPGEHFVGTFIPYLELVEYDRDTFLGDFFAGIDPAERNFLATVGNNGRAVIIITCGSRTNYLTVPSGNNVPPGEIRVPGGGINIGG
jgi:hypothetical protein